MLLGWVRYRAILLIHKHAPAHPPPGFKKGLLCAAWQFSKGFAGRRQSRTRLCLQCLRLPSFTAELCVIVQGSTESSHYLAFREKHHPAVSGETEGQRTAKKHNYGFVNS